MAKSGLRNLVNHQSLRSRHRVGPQNIPVYDTYGFSGWVNVAGTSISSPDWAAFFTLVNSLRAAQGKGTLSQGAQDLYTIYYSSNYIPTSMTLRPELTVIADRSV